MFLAVTASLLGYCQTDEKGKTQRRDSATSLLLTVPLSLLLVSLPRVSRVSPSIPFLLPLPATLSNPLAAKAASKEIRISLSASSNLDDEG